MVVLSKIWLLSVQVSGDSERVQNAQLRATLCLARAAGPAAVLSAVRRRLAGTARADTFCSKVSRRRLPGLWRVPGTPVIVSRNLA